MSTDEEFAKFVKFCEQNLTGANKQLISLIKKRYNDCNEKFKNSRELRHLLSSSRKKMSSDSKHLFVHLKDCLNELKAYSGNKGEKRKRKTEYDSDDHMWKRSKLSNGNILDSEETDSSVKSRSLTSSPVVIEEDSDKEVKSEQTSKTQDEQWRDKLKISPDVASRKLHTSNLATIIKNLKEKKLGESEFESFEGKPSISCLEDSAEDKTESADLVGNKPDLCSISGKSDVIIGEPCQEGDSTVVDTTSASGKLASNSTTDSGPDKTTSGSTVKPDASDCKKEDEDDDCIVIDDSPPCDDEHTTSGASSNSKAATTNKLSCTKSGSSESTQSRPDLSPENDTMVKGKIEASDAETATTNTVSDSLPSKSEERTAADPVSEHLPDTDSKQYSLSDNDAIENDTATNPEKCNDDIKVKKSDEDLEKVDVPSDTDQEDTDVHLEKADTSSNALKKQNVTDADLHQDIKEVCSESTETKMDNPEQTDNPEETEIMDTGPFSPRQDASSDQDTNISVASPDIHTASSSNVASVCSIAVESDSDHGESSALISDVKELESTAPEPSCSTDVPSDIITATKSPRSPRSPASASCSEDKKKNYEEKKEKKREVSAKHIHRLEKLLEKLRDKIDRIQEKELTLDDLDQEDSDYLFEDKLKKKFVAVWNKLCELKERAPSTGRPTERRFTYQGTRYPEVNKKIEKMINKKKIFPDFHDIRRLVAKVNISHKLHLNNPAVDSLAREAFTDVGNMLQHRRREDFVTTFGCKITDAVDIRQDPAMFDPDLRKKLDENKTQGKAKLEEVIRKYSDMQHSRGDIPEEVPEGSDEDKSDAEKSEDELEVVAITIEDLDSDNEDIILVESSPAKMIQPREPRSSSPQARIPSPRLNTPSPGPGTPSTQPGTPSQQQILPSPQQSIPLPQARTSSPLVTTLSTEARTPSPLQTTTSPQPRSPSPELITSPQPRTPSPELITSPQPRSPSPEVITSPEPRSPSPELITTSPQPRSPSPELITTSPQPRSPSPELITSPQPRSPSPELLSQPLVVVSPCETSPSSPESTDGSPKSIQPRSPCSSPLAVKKSSPPEPESPQTIQPRYAARVSPSSPIEIDDSVIVSDSDDDELSPVKPVDCSFATSFVKSSFDSNPVTSTVKKKTLIPANFGGKPFGPSIVNSESAGAGRNYVWTNSSTSSNGVKRLSLHKNSPVSSTSSLSMSSTVKMAATVKPFSVHKQPSSPLNRSREDMSQCSSFRQNTNHNRLSLHKSPSTSTVKQTIINRLSSYPQTAQTVNRTSGPSRQVRQSPQRESQHSQVMHNRVVQQTGQRQGGGSRQMPQTYNRMSQQMARTYSGGPQQFVRQYSGSSQQMTRPRSGVSQQLSRHGNGMSQQIVRPRSGVSQQVSPSQGRVYQQTSRSQSGMTSQMSRPRSGVSQQMTRPHNVVSQQVTRPRSGMLQQMSRPNNVVSQQLTRPRSGMSQQMVRSRGGVSHQVLPQQRGMLQQALHKRNGASRNSSQPFKEKTMSPLKQAMQMSSQCYIDIDVSAEEVLNEEEGGMEQDGEGDVREDGEDVVILSDSD